MPKLLTLLLLMHVMIIPSVAQQLIPLPCQPRPDGGCTQKFIPQSPYQTQQPWRQPPHYMFCYSNEPVRGTKTMIVSEVFQSSQTEQAAANDFSVNLTATFTCKSGSFDAMQREAGQMTANFSHRGYEVMTQVRRR